MAVCAIARVGSRGTNGSERSAVPDGDDWAGECKGGEAIVHNRHGQIRDRSSYGSDPRGARLEMLISRPD